MQLQVFYQTTYLTAYYDHSNEWVFLDWEGDITLPLVQESCAELATYFLHNPCTHVLNSNEQVTKVGWNVAAWLATDFLPHLALAGVEHVAWIYSSSLPGKNLVQTILNWLPGPVINSFGNLFDAVTWLQHSQPTPRQGRSLPTRSSATQAKLVQEVQALHQRIKAKQPKLWQV